MSKAEIPLQQDMFTGEFVDTRTRRQKEQDRARELPSQNEMFSQRDIAQFGVSASPLMPLSPDTRFVLIQEDPRSPEEKDRDLEREAQARTRPLESLVQGQEEGHLTKYPSADAPMTREADFELLKTTIEADPQYREEYGQWLDSLPTPIEEP
jgi:hypothetical protein